MNNKHLGDRGESCAEEYLRRQGYRILMRNYRTKIGESGLIWGGDRTRGSLEVKTRSSVRYGVPAEAVNYKKRQKIIQTAYWYLYEQRRENTICRFDVLEVYAIGDSWNVHQIKGAFET